MIRTIIKKELKQHFIPFLMLFILTGLAFLIMFLNSVTDSNKSYLLETLSNFIKFFTPIVAAVLCRRLVVIEYSNKTQHFLESLPISRFNFFIIKYLLGLSLILLIIGSNTLTSIIYTSKTSNISSHFILLITIKALSYIFFIYNFFHLMAYTGRYRYFIYSIILILYIYLDTNTNFQINKTAPFALVDSTFAYERLHFPKENIAITGLISAIMFGVSFFLGLAREGSISTAFSLKMSHKEKVILSSISLLIILSVTTFEEKKQKEPFDVPGAIVAEGDGVTIKIIGDPAFNIKFKDLSNYLHNEIVLMRKYLDIGYIKPIFIVQNDTLLPMIYKPVPLSKTEGNLYYVNILSKEWNLQSFQSYLIKTILLEHTAFQAGREKNYWITAGFAEFWSNRNKDRNKLLELRAAYGVEDLSIPAIFNSWYYYDRILGGDIMDSIAWTGINLLHNEYSNDEVQSFLQKSIGKPHSSDISALFTSHSSNSNAAYKTTFGSDYDKFLSNWSSYLELLNSKYSEGVEELPKIEASIITKTVSNSSISPSFRITSSNNTEELKDINFYCLYNKLVGINNMSRMSDMKHFRNKLVLNKEYEIPDFYSPGERLDYFILIYNEKLDCYISPSTSIEVIK